jgi:hypothetical protein
MFIWPHRLFVDKDGNVWVTDAVRPDRTPEGERGHVVVKFSSEGEVLMTLGVPGKTRQGRLSVQRPRGRSRRRKWESLYCRRA